MSAPGKRSGQVPKPVDTWRSRIGASLLNVCCINYFNILPIVLGGATASRGLAERELGWVAAAFMAGLTLANLTGFLWVRRWNWRAAVVASNLVAAAAFLAPLSAFGAGSWMLANMVAGAATGISFGISVACLADSTEKERNFAIAWVGQTFVSAGLVFALPRIDLGVDLVVLGQCVAALLMVVGVATAWMIPPRGAKDAREPGSVVASVPPGLRLALVLGLFVLVANTAAETSVWTYLERIASGQQLSLEFASTAISASFFTAGLGSLVAAIIGRRFGRTAPFLVAVGASIGSVALFAWLQGPGPYFLAVLLFAAAWNLGGPYRMALAADADPTGRFTTFIPAMQTLGATLGPAAAGLLIGPGGFGPVYVFAAGLWTATVLAFLVAQRRVRFWSRAEGTQMQFNGS
ncbi:MAG: hypothetical protein AMJ58_05415 [Gammaproteobacteria bacterium SG8_30]|nr:MAG: hypothetical protein AMJ58_05415 [Gammaproteobacteria bacterium SG8_30]